MFQAGFSRLDVTPPLGAELSGYFHIRYAKGVLDPIYLNTLALQDDKTTVILMALDFIGIRLPFIKKLKQRISKRTGVPEDNVIIAALHQHTSCRIDQGSLSDLTDETYKDVLFRKMEDGAVMAIEDLAEAKLFSGEKETAEPISFVRRYVSDEGEVLTNPRTSIYKIVKRCGEADNTVRLLRFAREEKKDIVLLNFSTPIFLQRGRKNELFKIQGRLLAKHLDLALQLRVYSGLSGALQLQYQHQSHHRNLRRG